MRAVEVKKGVWRAFIVHALALLLLTVTAVPAASQSRSVAEEILDVLRANGQISEQQYQELVNKARVEEERRAKAPAEMTAGKEEKKKGADFRAYWDKGPKFETADKSIEFKIIGRTMVDFGAVTADDEIEDAFPDIEGHGAEMRRARIGVEGTLYDTVLFKTEVDFASGGEVELKDLFVGYTGFPFVEEVLVGHMKEPVSLEELTSSKYITFMERSLPNVFVPSRNLGVRLFGAACDNRLTWSAGVFEQVDDDDVFSFNDYSDVNVSARVTGLPWRASESQFLHLGLGYQHRFRSGENNPVEFRQRPEIHLTDARLVDTGELFADSVDVVVPEAAFVWGPFSLQGEYMHAFVSDDVLNDDSQFYGFYAFASYFLTGEHRNYKGGAFDRITPKVNFHPTEGGCGAWELAVRYSYIDLEDNGIQGGKESNVTAGINWYLNPNARIMFNYVLAMVDEAAGFPDVDGNAHAFMSRFQVDW